MEYQCKRKRRATAVSRRRSCYMAGSVLILAAIHQTIAFSPSVSSSPLLQSNKYNIKPLHAQNSAMERGEMILASDSDRLLNAAFSSLNDRDKYETVLTGLCAKVIDGGADNAKEGLVDPMRLLEEMNASGIMSGARGIIGLIDVSLSYWCSYVCCDSLSHHVFIIYAFHICLSHIIYLLHKLEYIIY